jgi:hypothetical protein
MQFHLHKQWNFLNLITLIQSQTDYINRFITITKINYLHVHE